VARRDGRNPDVVGRQRSAGLLQIEHDVGVERITSSLTGKTRRPGACEPIEFRLIRLPTRSSLNPTASSPMTVTGLKSSQLVDEVHDLGILP
jgi:hypothetical protein